ncbi:MAG TPA: 16S rRNA (guanine(527)-N(7))-methyltransferase RsmG, partial [Pasteurellaceae bacterium]|nr:16S rRNA (guanine(527)-N(7))-methyltransferase RsmG [Pasteurellaceae bacterium]
IRELGLKNVEPVLSRVEEYNPDYKFDGVLSRAFASLEDMTHWCCHLLARKGFFYALKGVYHQDEAEQLGDSFIIERLIKLEVPELVGE